ncbi:exodeoxyribonuclease V subunit alpha [Sodalis sp. CWE]|uniref:exodeoxyribonuclease V subunit alpha n=1 Tax=Sodalis sp. CWE TaxID=2803816 RepID=UPI001C7DA3A0|nr:exodeoxyribonuclease V subunit alpha [Sodalis sp. CWE]MBX4180886.1 exodeoxyribonuclease V subunit alpha [Sodalis sp. CWE]
MESILYEAKQLNLWRSIDIQFALMVATPTQPALMLVSAWLSADTGAGHTCLPIKMLTPEKLFDGKMPILAKKAWEKAGCSSVDEWEKILLASQAVSNGSHQTPLVLDMENQLLYLHRMWRYECEVAKFFNTAQSFPISENDEKKIKVILNDFFPMEISSNKLTNIDWNKIAVAIAITRSISVISGAPGTGKTFTVSKILAALLQLSNGKNLRILMAAPTGKAAVRLSEVVHLSLKHLGLEKKQKLRLPCFAVTLHHLLGIQPDSNKTRYHRNNLLYVDILVIDEASMIDLPMMAKIIDAIPLQAKVILLGDCHQLLPIEAGSVLRDIFHFAKSGYSFKQKRRLMRITGCVLPNNNKTNNNIDTNFNVADSLCLLNKSYRFDENSDIGRLADMINIGDSEGVLSLLTSETISDINYSSLCDQKEEYELIIKTCINGYSDYLKRIKNFDQPAVILRSFNQFRLLCALREGPFGVEGLNNRIENNLSQAGLFIIDSTKNKHYAGRPIMVMCNDPSLELYNGDIGVILFKKEDEKNGCPLLQACFSLPNGKIKTVALSRLPKHETAFAMTVHKSQGSEFQQVTLVLPNYSVPILTRELLYTAVTRAKSRLSIHASKEIMRYTILTKTQRHSGLVKRLNTFKEKRRLIAI